MASSGNEAIPPYYFTLACHTKKQEKQNKGGK